MRKKMFGMTLLVVAMMTGCGVEEVSQDAMSVVATESVSEVKESMDEGIEESVAEITTESQENVTNEELVAKLIEEESKGIIHERLLGQYNNARTMLSKFHPEYELAECLGFVLLDYCSVESKDAYASNIVFSCNEGAEILVFGQGGGIIKEPEWTTAEEFYEFAKENDKVVLIKGMEEQLAEISLEWKRTQYEKELKVIVEMEERLRESENIEATLSCIGVKRDHLGTYHEIREVAFSVNNGEKVLVIKTNALGPMPDAGWDTEEAFYKHVKESAGANCDIWEAWEIIEEFTPEATTEETAETVVEETVEEEKPLSPAGEAKKAELLAVIEANCTNLDEIGGVKEVVGYIVNNQTNKELPIFIASDGNYYSTLPYGGEAYLFADSIEVFEKKIKNVNLLTEE